MNIFWPFMIAIILGWLVSLTAGAAGWIAVFLGLWAWLTVLDS